MNVKYMKRLTATRPMENITTTSGGTLTPGVSSSKNRSKPALAAGIGASRLRRFSRALDKVLAFPYAVDACTDN